MANPGPKGVHICTFPLFQHRFTYLYKVSGIKWWLNDVNQCTQSTSIIIYTGNKSTFIIGNIKLMK